MIRISLYLALAALSSVSIAHATQVSRIQIEGRRWTRAWVIERELAFCVGDTLRMEALATTRNRLLNLAIFNRVDVSADSAGTVTIGLVEAWHLWPLVSLNLEETQLSELFESPRRFFEGTSLDLGAVDLNFLGRAANFWAFARMGTSRGGAINYRTRWFSPGLPLFVRAHFRNLRISNRHAAVLGLERSLDNTRAELQVGTREGRHARVGIKLRYESVQEEPLWAGVAAPRDKVGHGGVFLVIDRRDLEWYPSKGSYVWLEGNYIGGDRHYFHSESDARAFWPLTKGMRPMVLALRLRGGTASSGMPAWGHWFFGFNTGFRGYRTEKSEADGYLSGAAELRFPLTRIVYVDLPFGDRFRRLPFGLNGLVFLERTELRLGRQRSELLATGIGLACRVPYVQILEVDFSLSAEGKSEFGATIGMAL
ncbi:MAG: BamA/TamA family outer membrane protein [bacterium]